MVKSNWPGIKHTAATESNLPYVAPRVPSIGGKLFRRTSESAGNVG